MIKPRHGKLQLSNMWNQEIIKVREWIPLIGPLTKVIRLKLFLDIVPSSFADVTRALRGCFRGGSVYVSFRFVLKQSKTSNSGDVFDIMITSKGASTPASLCCNTFRNLKGSLNKKTDVSCSNNTNWMNGREMFRQMTNDKQTSKHKLGNRTNRWSKVQAGRRSLPK